MTKVLQVLNKDVPLHDYRTYLSTIDFINIEFIVPPTSKKYKNIKKHHIELTGGFSLKKELSAIKNLYIFLLKNKYDIIHWYSSKYYLIGPILGVLTFNKNNIITVNGFGRVFTSRKFFLLKPVFLFFFFISSFLSKKIILQNKEDLKFTKKILPSFFHSKLSLVYSGVREVQNFDKKENSFNVLNISRIMNEKGIIEFLKIAEKVKEINSEIKFTLIGESSNDEKLDNILNEYIKKEIITYISYTDEPFKYINNTNLLLFTSYREGLPRVVIESLSCSVPVLGYDVIGVNEVVEDNNTGYLFKKHEVDLIVEKIIELEKNNDELKILSKRSKKQFNTKFTMNNYLNKMEQIYKGV